MRYETGGARVLVLGLVLGLVACGGEAESRDAAGVTLDAEMAERVDGLSTVEDTEAEAVDERKEEAATRVEAPAPVRREAAPAPVRAVSEPAPERAPEPVRSFPAGTLLTFEVLENVSTSSHSEGDGFALRLVNGVSGVAGAYLPAGASAEGLVHEARKSPDASEEAVLAVGVRSVDLDGRPFRIRGHVESASIETFARDSGTRTAAKVATGTAAGAVVGRILGGDSRSAVKGAVVGTAAGAGVAVATRDGHATLPRGSQITVVLEEAWVVN